MGDDKNLAAFAYFWQDQAHNLQIVVETKLIAYTMQGGFTPQELDSYILGLTVLMSFIEDCNKEYNLKKSQQEIKKEMEALEF